MTAAPISLTILRKGDTNIIDLAEVGVLIPRSETRVDDAFLREVSAEVGSIGLPRYGRDDHVAVVRDLQRIGELIFSHLLPEATQQRLRAAQPGELYLRLDESLLQVPWELCYDGEQFLALKFRLGRQVITSAPLPRRESIRSGQGALRVLLIADPTETLPQASQEAEQLCEILGGLRGVDVTLLGGHEVRKTSLLLALQAHDLVHFAGHSQYDAQTPSHSGWVLQEGILTAGELRKLARPPSLVFSNSCQAGATAAWSEGAQYAGQAFGIGSAFLLAGVQNYVGTFWVVPDEESTVFATAFYRSLTAGQNIGDALFGARQTLIAQRGWAGLTWASYMLYGDPAYTVLPPTQARPLSSVSTAEQPQGAQVMQRKLTAILSADVKGYSRLMGEDEVATIRTLTTYRAVMTTLIQQHHGRVVDAPGDNLLAEFASAVDAVQCAVEIQKELQTRNAELPDHRQMQYRIGLNVGDVIVEGERLYGDGVNIAARLEALAEGGGICISGTVYDQVESKLAVKYGDLGEQTVKNIAKPVRVYQVLASIPSTPPVASSQYSVASSAVQSQVQRQDSTHRIPPSALVGRETELTQLHQCLEKALHGERQVVFLTGEPGIGKTTLVDAFLHDVGEALGSHPASGQPQRVAPTPTLWLGQGQCIEHYGAGEAYLPVLTALGQLGREPGGQRLVEILGQHAPTWLVQMPGLLSAADLEALQRKTLGATRERMLREMGEAIDAITAEQPLVLWLEDLHWSDPSTLELLSLLARQREPARLLVIGTYRPVDVIVSEHPLRAVKQELQLHGHCQELVVRLLTEEAVVEYLAVKMDATEEVECPVSLQSVARAIHQRTEGNPLFMVNVVEELRAQGTTDSAAVERSMPATIRQMIERQFDRVTAAAQRVIEAASVAGMEFSAAAVAAGVEIAVDEIEECCAGLARRGQFLQIRGTAEWPDGTIAARYGFIHALYQEVVYERVTAGRRVRLHLRIGEREEAAYGHQAREIAAELAVHFEQGRDTPKAVRYLRQAGQNALRRSAHQEAIRHFTKGLELLKTLPDTPERARQELTLQIALGSPLIATKGYAVPEVQQTYTRARELCRRVGTTPQLFPALRGLWLFHFVGADLPLAYELGEQLLTLAQSEEDPAFLLEAHRAMGTTLFFQGQLPQARAQLEQGIALYDPQQARSLLALYGQDPRGTCLGYTAWVLWLLGYPEQALKKSHEALALARELAHPFSLAFALVWTAHVRQFRRDGQAAQELAETIRALSHEQGFTQRLAEAMILRGWALAEQGQVEEGIAQMRQGLVAYRATGAEVQVAELLALLAEAYGKAGQAEEGLATLAEALTVVDKSGERFYEAELYRLKGELTLQSESQSLESRTREAEACFLKAIEIARGQEAKSLELRAVMSLSRLWQSQGKRDEAQQILTDIYNWFTEGFDTADLKEAKALLDALEDREVERQEEKNGPRREGSIKRTEKETRSQQSAALRLETEAPTSEVSGEQARALTLPDKPSIAVLPFTNMSADPAQEYFSDGITEDLITSLSKVSGLFIIARHSVFTYKRKVVTPGQVGRELGVRYVVEGSVRKVGNRVRINVQLIEAATDGHLWAERYDRELTDIFALQDEIIQKIVFALKVTLSPEEHGRFCRAPTTNLDAYDYYLRAETYLWRVTQQSTVQARQLFEKALELDPQYAAAMALLGLTYLADWGMQWSHNPRSSLEQGFELAQKAVTLDASTPVAHVVLSQVAQLRKQHEQAIAAAEQAAALDPNYALGYGRLGEALSYAGRPAEAIGWLERAMRLDPYEPTMLPTCLGHAYILLEQYEKAVTALKKAMVGSPDLVHAHVYLAIAYTELGQTEEARTEVRRIARLFPPMSLEEARQRLPYKDPAVAERLLNSLQKAVAMLRVRDYVYLFTMRLLRYVRSLIGPLRPR